MQNLEATITDLQMRLAFQEDQIASLDDVIAQQDRRIEVLEIQLQHVAKRLKEMTDVSAALPIVDQKPPHY